MQDLSQFAEPIDEMMALIHLASDRLSGEIPQLAPDVRFQMATAIACSLFEASSLRERSQNQARHTSSASLQLQRQNAD